MCTLSPISLSICLSFFLFLAVSPLIAQKNFFGEEAHVWEKSEVLKIPLGAATYSQEGLVCLEDKTDFFFYSTYNQKIDRHLTFLINSAAGVEKLNTFTLPESFDIAYDAGYAKQGRLARIKTPFINNYRIVNLTARKQRVNRWQAANFTFKSHPIKWIRSTGEFINDEATDFQFQDLKAGDILEIYYESEFGSDAGTNPSYARPNRPKLSDQTSNYGFNLFYFHQTYPKLYAEYNFIYSVEDKFVDYAFILPVNIPDSLVSTTKEAAKNSVLFHKKIVLTNLAAMNYPENACESKQFPYVFADFKFYRVIASSFSDGDSKLIDYSYVRAKNFEWQLIRDTTNNYSKIYDKQFTSLRQFMTKLPPVSNDSSEVVFLKNLSDTLNSFVYLTINDLFYNRSELYNLYSADHLLKRRLVESTVWKLTQDILNENKISYYKADVQDNRYGENTIHYRANFSYENYLFMFPIKKTFVPMVPRTNGVSYYLNEVPFYYEGSPAALISKNFQEVGKTEDDANFKMVRIHKGSSNENSRTENATVTINTDSLIAHLKIRESLSGQYSTILRHYYLNTYIDSTLSRLYFKKCTEKPGATDIKLKLSSKSSESPFRYTFVCSENIKLGSKNVFSLKDWFSFVVFGAHILKVPTQDYYFDFENTDTYNFLINFNAPTDIENGPEFSNNLDNDYYHFFSTLEKQSERSYLLKVELKIKTRKLPKAEGVELLKLAEALNTLNAITLKLKSS